MSLFGNQNIEKEFSVKAAAPRYAQSLPGARIWAGMKLYSALPLIIPIAVFALYARSLFYPLTNYDDYEYINSTVKSGLNAGSLHFAFTSRYSYYSPVTWLSFMLECSLFPSAGAGIFRVTNIWLHIANSFLLLKFLGRLFAGSRVVPLVVLLFALHPIQVESVVWVSERKGLLAAFFALLCLNDYVSLSARGGSYLALRAAFFYILSIFSKPSLFCLCLLLPLIRLLLLKRQGEQRSTRLVEFSCIGITACAVPLQILLQSGTLGSGEGARFHFSASAGSYVLYIAKLLYPVDLVIPYQRYAWSIAEGSIAAIILMILTALFWNFGRKAPAVLFGWGWFLILLFPMTGIVPLGQHGLANRYLYLPSVGLFISVVFVLERALGDLQFVRIAICSASIAAFALFAWHEIGFWRDTESLFGRTLRTDPSNSLAREILYREAIRKEDFDEAQSYSNPVAYGDARKRYGVFHAYFRSTESFAKGVDLKK